MGLVDVPFAIPNLRCENGEAEAHTRIGWFRSVSNIPHGFAVQSFVAELAHAMGRDPKEVLLELIGPPRIVDPRKSQYVTQFPNYGDPFETYPIDTARLRRVVELVADRGEWGRTLPPRHGLGMAAHRSFLSYVATVVEVAVDEKGNLSVPRVDTAIDCGFAANPERIRSQIEGAAVMGLGIARYGEISFKNGRVEQSNFDSFQVARIDEVAGADACPHRPGRARCAVERGRRAGPPARSRRRCAMRSSPPPASASAGCRSAISWPPEAMRRGGFLRPLPPDPRGGDARPATV